MFYDDAIEVRNKPIRKLSPDATDAEADEWKRQLDLLEESTPIFDVDNLFETLNPTLIEASNPAADKRNAEMVETRNEFLEHANAAPILRLWDAFWLEHKYSLTGQRLGYIVRYDLENHKYVTTMVFDSLAGNGGIHAIVDAFELLPSPDTWMFASYNFRHSSSHATPENDRGMKEAAEVTRSVIEMLNWRREDVPMQTTQQTPPSTSRNQPCFCGSGIKWKHCHGKGKGGAPPPAKEKSSPTIIKFEPFLQRMKNGNHNGSGNGVERHVGLHRVKGHYMNVIGNPIAGTGLFGHKAVPGKTVGRIIVPPHVRGNPKYGTVRKKGKLVVGDVKDPNGSQPNIPFPTNGDKEKE